MPKAREAMTAPATWIDADATVAEAAALMADDAFGMLPVCDGQGRLQGAITDRDIIVRVVAEKRDPATVRVRDVAGQGEVVTIGADDDLMEAIETMKRHNVRRLPVIDGTKLVGMVSQADVARVAPDTKVSELVEAISSAPPNN